MERAEREALFDDFLDLLVHESGFRELQSAVEYAMADCRDLIDCLYDAVVCIDKSVKDELDRLLMGRHRGFDNIVFQSRDLMCQHGAFDTDAFA